MPLQGRDIEIWEREGTRGGRSIKRKKGWGETFEIRQLPPQYPANDIRDTSGTHLTDDKSNTRQKSISHQRWKPLDKEQREFFCISWLCTAWTWLTGLLAPSWMNKGSAGWLPIFLPSSHFSHSLHLDPFLHCLKCKVMSKSQFCCEMWLNLTYLIPTPGVFGLLALPGAPEAIVCQCII